MSLMTELSNSLIERREHPEFRAGDTVSVHYRIIEGEKERIQIFQGVVLQKKGSGLTATFTVRKISNSVGVERIFPLYSPKIDKLVVEKYGKVRRARIFYIREIKGKNIKIKPRIFVKKNSK